MLITTSTGNSLGIPSIQPFSGAQRAEPAVSGSYVGAVIGLKANGSGTFTMHNGDRHVGEWKASKLRHGRSTYSNGEEYDGERGLIEEGPVGPKSGKGKYQAVSYYVLVRHLGWWDDCFGAPGCQFPDLMLGCVYGFYCVWRVPVLEWSHG